MRELIQQQVSRPSHARALLLARRGCGIGSTDSRRPTRPGLVYRLNWRPALAEIVGDGRPWTVLMISLLSIPSRDAEVGVSELPLDHDERDPLVGHFDRVSVSQLMIVPTSAQASLRRHDRYAEAGEKVRARWDVGRLRSA